MKLLVSPTVGLSNPYILHFNLILPNQVTTLTILLSHSVASPAKLPEMQPPRRHFSLFEARKTKHPILNILYFSPHFLLINSYSTVLYLYCTVLYCTVYSESIHLHLPSRFTFLDRISTVSHPLFRSFLT